MSLVSVVTGLAMLVNFSNVHPAAQSHAKIQTASAQKPNVVIINDGDTLEGIASAHQTTYVRLFDANPDIADPDVINVGDKVRIPAPSEQLPDRQLPDDPAIVSAPTTEAPLTQPHPAISTPMVPVVQSAPVAGCGDNFYANFIYSRESGCRTTAMSPNGCYGIGQACPASKLAYCGADYACQNAYFTAYAGKYGGWAGAYAFWVAHGWW